MDIARQTGFDRRTVAKWIRAEALPERSASAPKATSPRHFEEYLSRRWSEGCVRGRRLFQEVKAREYTGSFSNLERLLAKWRNPKRKAATTAPIVPRPPPLDPATGRSTSPIVAAALCIKPRGLLTANQAAKSPSSPLPARCSQEDHPTAKKATTRTALALIGPS